jgi:hypothetical protein
MSKKLEKMLHPYYNWKIPSVERAMKTKSFEQSWKAEQSNEKDYRNSLEGHSTELVSK